MPPLIQQVQSNVERQRIYRFRYEVYIEEMGKCMPEADAT